VPPCRAMKLVLLSALMGLAFGAQADYTVSQFSSFMAEHGKQYDTKAEYNLRLSIFKENLAKIEYHNRSGASWKMAVNQFSDLTQEEFEATMTGGYKRTPGMSGVPLAKVATATKTRAELPDSVDWRDKGVVTPAKNQGSCGSCWAFATTELIESYAAINSPTNELITLSAKQVTGCTPNPSHCGGTGGCQGSIPQLGFTYVQLFGHVTEDDMPYNRPYDSCDYDYANTQPVVGLTGYNTLPANDQDAVMQHLAEVGPLAVAVYASGWGSYGGGIYSGCKYSSNIALNHAVMLVGYGSEGGEKYWIVRNSWGSSWGEQGYIRLQRDDEAQCGTDSSPMDGTACEGGPGNDVQHVCGECGVLFDCSWPLGAHEWTEP